MGSTQGRISVIPIKHQRMNSNSAINSAIIQIEGKEKQFRDIIDIPDSMFHEVGDTIEDAMKVIDMTYIHTYIHTNIHTYIHACIHTYIHS